MAISVSPRTEVGDRLKEARARRGVDLQEAARVTRIRPRFLEALERGASPRTFRAPVYARAFLREYARYLGLDPEPLVEEYRAAHGDRDPLPMPLPGQVDRPRRPALGQVLLAVVTAAALVALGVVTVREASGPAADRALPSATLDDRAPEVAPPPTVPEARDIRLRVRLKDRPSWLLVVVDGDVAVRGGRGQGFNRVFRGSQRIRIDIDDAGAARLTLNGESLGAPGPSRVGYRASYVLRNGEVRVTPAS